MSEKFESGGALVNHSQSFGAEIEKPISTLKTGESHGVGQDFFLRLGKKRSGSSLKHSDVDPDCILGVADKQIGLIGLDNAFNNLETSTVVAASLGELAVILDMDHKLAVDELENEGAAIVNMSNHPLVRLDDDSYRNLVAPKGIYKYIWARGWDHKVLVDAKAQNSANTGINPEDGARAVTTMLGSGAALVGLFANSPFSQGEVAGNKASRLLVWDEFMRGSRSEGDRKTARFPEKPFATLKDYFVWMFGEGTNIHFVMDGSANYKTFGEGAILIDGDPGVIDFLRQDRVAGRRFLTGEKVVVKPKLGDLEVMQFASFVGARFRWHFNPQLDKQEFLKALDADRLEQLFADGGVEYAYVEGRDPGANFADEFLLDADQQMAETVLMAPSAIQAGLLQNLDESYNHVNGIGWNKLKQLRQAAIKDGLDGEVDGLSVVSFSKNILELAARGLAGEDQKFLQYPKYVLETGSSGADRALKDYDEGKSIREIIIKRHVKKY